MSQAQARLLQAPRSDSEIHERREQEGSAAEIRKAREHWETIVRDIGKRYAAVSLDQFRAVTDEHEAAVRELRKFVAELPDRSRSGCGLLLHGPRGTGKDHLAVSCLRQACLEHHLPVAWVDGQDLFSGARDVIGKEQTERGFIRRYTAPAVLLISDPVPQDGALTDFQQSTLWRILDRRYRDLKPTWVTVNASGENDLVKRLGAQMVDRLVDGALVISTMGWKSYRKPFKAKT